MCMVRTAHLHFNQMENRTERNAPWPSVPRFGDWDQKGELPDHSMDFSKIREMREQNKGDVSRASLGNEDELINPAAPAVKTTSDDDQHHYHQSRHSSTTRRSFLRYFNCWAKS